MFSAGCKLKHNKLKQWHLIVFIMPACDLMSNG